MKLWPKFKTRWSQREWEVRGLAVTVLNSRMSPDTTEQIPNRGPIKSH